MATMSLFDDVPCYAVFKGFYKRDFPELSDGGEVLPQYETNDVNMTKYTKLPSKFTGLDNWIYKTNIHCWNCTLSFDEIPLFIPKLLEITLIPSSYISECQYNITSRSKNELTIINTNNIINAAGRNTINNNTYNINNNSINNINNINISNTYNDPRPDTVVDARSTSDILLRLDRTQLWTLEDEFPNITSNTNNINNTNNTNNNVFMGIDMGTDLTIHNNTESNKYNINNSIVRCETYGVFCSGGCIIRHILNTCKNRNEFFEIKTAVLNLLSYIHNKKIIDIEPSDDKSTLEMYGGTTSIQDYKAKLSYCIHYT